MAGSERSSVPPGTTTIGDLRNQLNAITEMVKPYTILDESFMVSADQAREGFRVLSQSMVTANALISTLCDHTDATIRRVEVLEQSNTHLINIDDMLDGLQNKFITIDSDLKDLKTKVDTLGSTYVEDQKKFSVVDQAHGITQNQVHDLQAKISKFEQMDIEVLSMDASLSTIKDALNMLKDQ